MHSPQFSQMKGNFTEGNDARLEGQTNQDHLEPNLLEEEIKPTNNADRNWWFTDYFKKYHSKKSPRGLDFKIMSYNILSQRLLDKHPHLYENTNPKYLEWEYRINNLLFELGEQDPDIVCLQEVEEERYYDTFEPELEKRGYGGLFKKKTRDKFDGCAIFFKKIIFSLEKAIHVEYYRDDVEVLNRDNIGLIAILKPNNEHLIAKKLCVATTHLLFNPKRIDVRLTQLRLLLAEIEKNAVRARMRYGKVLYHPILLCGDFNEEPYSSVYDFLVTGHIQSMYSSENDPLSLQAIEIDNNTQFFHGIPSNNDKTAISTGEANISEASMSSPCHFEKMPEAKYNIYSHFLNLISVYEHTNKDGLKESTTYHMAANCTVDYIFYNVAEKMHDYTHRIYKRNELIHLGCYGLLNKTQMSDLCSLPNAHISSDHTCLISRFLLT